MSTSSSRRAEANRLNAQKSTGPRTPEGKARSSMNAVTHGLTSQAALLEGEDPAKLEELGAEMMAHLKPADPVQRALAERIVALTWRLRRVARAEAATAIKIEGRRQREWKRDFDEAERMNRPPPGPPAPLDAGRLLADSFHETGAKGETAVDGPLVRITRYEMKLDSALRGAIRELRAVRRDAAREAEHPRGSNGGGIETLNGGSSTSASASESESEPEPGSGAALRLPRRGDDSPPAAVQAPVVVPDVPAGAPQSATERRAAPHSEHGNAPEQIEPNAHAQGPPADPLP